MSGPYTSRDELINEAILLWKKHGIDYRTLLVDYHNNLKIRRALGLKINRLNSMFLDEYPDIVYMEFNTEYKARHYLEMLDTWHILAQVNSARNFDNADIVKALRKHNSASERMFKHTWTRKKMGVKIILER